MKSAFVLLLAPLTVLGAPQVSSVSGTFSDGQQVTVLGSGFGNTGPNIVLFDDFSGGGAHDSALPASAVIGRWDNMSSRTWVDPLLSNGKGARIVHESGWHVNRVLFGAPYAEVYISSRAYVPDGYRFPSAGAEREMPSISALKHHWLFYGQHGYGEVGHDIFGPNWTGANWHRVTSNKSKQYVFQQTGSPGWDWGRPVRWTHWIKGDRTTEGTQGFFQGLSSSGQTQVHYDASNMGGKTWFSPEFESQGIPYAFDRATVVGYLRSGMSYPRDNYVIDDVYVAVGGGAAARVEIASCSDYSRCDRIAIGTPTAWADGKIDVVIREGDFNDGDQVYLFVVDADNTPSRGFGPLTLGGRSSSPPPSAPAPPTALNIQ